MQVEALNLSHHYEQTLLSSTRQQPADVPAIIVTGFLGSGKTTLVQHILRNRCGLKVAVLVNEVGVDLDSTFINVKQSNAAVGVTGSDLSGGCLCCHGHSELVSALKQIRGEACPDYLVLETSGAADAEPLRDVLVGHGFRLDAVVTVVDAECGADLMQQQEVARRQVQSADMVVINKCDLSSLGALSDLEDLLQRMEPGVRVMRARFGAVPNTALLDIEPVDATSARDRNSSSAQSAAATTSAPAQEVGVLSHESAPTLAGQTYRVAGRAAGSAKRPADAATAHHHSAADADGGAGRHAAGTREPTPGSAPDAANGGARPDSQPAQSQHGHHHEHTNGHHHRLAAGDAGVHSRSHTDHHHDHKGGADDQHAVAGGAGAHAPHAALHSDFHTLAITELSRPLSMAAFQAFVLEQLLPSAGLYRAKGILWFRECRRQRYVFHLSGRQRVECRQEAGQWSGPPATQLVLIGKDPNELSRLRDCFLSHCVSDSAPPQASVAAVATHMATLIDSHERFVCKDSHARNASSTVGPQPDVVEPTPGPGPSSLIAGVVQFSAQSALQHGIQGEDINLSIMQRVNASRRALLYGVDAPQRISSVSNMQSADRVAALQYVVALAHLHPNNISQHGAASSTEVSHSTAHVPSSAASTPPATSPAGGSGGSSLQPEDAVATATAAAAAAAASAAAAAWQGIMSVAEPVLRKAYSHVHTCKCDVVALMHAARN